MKKNLLLLMVSLVVGMISAHAYNVRINVDKYANVKITTQSGNGTTLDLTEDGLNGPFDLDESASPLLIEPANGATLTKVLVNESPANISGDGMSRVGITGNTMIEITTTGGGEAPKAKYNTWIQPSILGSITVTCGEETTIVEEAKYTEYEEGSELIIAPVEGYEITNVDYSNSAYTNIAVNNGDGTWSITPDHNFGYANVIVKELGVAFSVDVNYPSNIVVVANLDNDCTITKELTPSGNGPYSYTAPKEVKSLNFYPANGAQIFAITRIDANGAEMIVNNSGYVGWRTAVTEGDTFVVDAKGADADITFATSRGPAVSNYAVIYNGTTYALTEENSTVKIPLGDVFSVTGKAGTTLNYIYTLTEDVKEVSSANGIITARVLAASGTVYLYGEEKSETTIYVDNAAAVVVTGSAGNGDVVSLVNGSNIIETVQNPLKITATEGYRIASVMVDGQVLSPNADGSYTAELLAKGSLYITTVELPKPFPVSFSVIGDNTKLIITKDGDPTEFAGLMALPGGTVLTVKSAMGYKITALTVSGSNSQTYDEATETYTIKIGGAGTIAIVVEEWIAQEGYALVTFNSNHYLVSAFENTPEGVRVGKLEMNAITEVKIGNTILVTTFGDRKLTSVTVNGTEITIAEDGKSASFTVEGTTDLNVVCADLCYISGWKTSNPENHSFLGYVYINEVGTENAYVAQGGTFTVIPVAERGYKFTGFSYVYPEEIEALVPDEVQETYTFTVPEGVTSIIFQGAFEPADERKIYTLRGGNCIVDGNVSSDAIVYIDDNGALLREYNAYEGDVINLTTTSSIAGAEIETYCLYYGLRPVTVPYVVKAEDADANGTITFSAIVWTPAGITDAAVSTLTYNAAEATIYAPAAVKVFNATGILVAEGQTGSLSVEHLASGIYIAVSGNESIKFQK